MKTCQQCQMEYDGPGKSFCSIGCANKGRPSTRYSLTKKCPTCENSFSVTSADVRKAYCSRRCSAIANNIRRGIKSGTGKVRCGFCGADTERKWKTQTFCNAKCKAKFELNAWLSGSVSGTGTRQYRFFVKKWLLERANYRCESCGFSRSRPDGRSILQVDHIDGRWSNNTPQNLRILCPNCHAMTPNWGGANRGKGREFRYKKEQK